MKTIATRPEPFREGGFEIAPRERLVQRRHDLAVRAHALVHLDHLAIEEFREPDVAVEYPRPVLVGDAQLVAEAAGDEERRGLALPLQQRIGGDRRAHLHRLDALDGNRPVRCHVQEMPDGGESRVAIALGILGEQLVGEDGSVGTPGDDVRERAASVDPELPAGGMGGAHRGGAPRRQCGLAIPRCQSIDKALSRSLP